MTVPYRRVVLGQVPMRLSIHRPSDDKKYHWHRQNTRVENGRIVGSASRARRGESFFEIAPNRVDMIGIALRIHSVGSGLIPFLEHDDANRALMAEA